MFIVIDLSFLSILTILEKINDFVYFFWRNLNTNFFQEVPFDEHFLEMKEIQLFNFGLK